MIAAGLKLDTFNLFMHIFQYGQMVVEHDFIFTNWICVLHEYRNQMIYGGLSGQAWQTVRLKGATHLLTIYFSPNLCEYSDYKVRASPILLLATRCLLSLSWFEYRPGHVTKSPLTWSSLVSSTI